MVVKGCNRFAASWFRSYLLYSSIFLILIVVKKTHHLEKCIILQLLIGRHELSWNVIYYIYAVVFGTLTLMTHVHTILVVFYFSYVAMAQNFMIAVIGVVISLMYFKEACVSYKNYAADKEKIHDEKFGLKIYTKILRIIGRFLIVMKLIVAILTITWLILDPILKLFNLRHRYHYPYYGWNGNYDISGREQGAGTMMLVLAGIIIFVAISSIVFTTRKMFGNKKLNKDIMVSGLNFGSTIAIATMAFFGLGFSVTSVFNPFTDNKVTYLPPFIFYGTLSITTLLMVLGEAHMKPEEIGFQSVEIDSREDERKSMLSPEDKPVNFAYPKKSKKAGL